MSHSSPSPIDQELELGLCSLSVPLLDTHGNVVAALNVGAHSLRISLPEMIEAYLPLLLKSQERLRPLLDGRAAPRTREG